MTKKPAAPITPVAPVGNKRGPKPIVIDWVQFDTLCQLQCTLEELAFAFKCSVDTIERRVEQEKKLKFAEYYKIVSAGGKMSLRRWQFAAAKKGNTSMLIWLGKQYLKQSDKMEGDGKPLSLENVKTIADFFSSPVATRVIEDIE